MRAHRGKNGHIEKRMLVTFTWILPMLTEIPTKQRVVILVGVYQMSLALTTLNR